MKFYKMYIFNILMVLEIVILSILLVDCKKIKDIYCKTYGTCQNIDTKVYTNRALIRNIYNDNKLIEISNRERRVSY
jgi:hypothetical protein